MVARVGGGCALSEGGKVVVFVTVVVVLGSGGGSSVAVSARWYGKVPNHFWVPVVVRGCAGFVVSGGGKVVVLVQFYCSWRCWWRFGCGFRPTESQGAKKLAMRGGSARLGWLRGEQMCRCIYVISSLFAL